MLCMFVYGHAYIIIIYARTHMYNLKINICMTNNDKNISIKYQQVLYRCYVDKFLSLDQLRTRNHACDK